MSKKKIKRIEVKVYDEKIPKLFGIRRRRARGAPLPEYPPHDISRSAFIPSGKAFVKDKNLTSQDVEKIRGIWKRIRFLFRTFQLKEITINLGFVKVVFKR